LVRVTSSSITITRWYPALIIFLLPPLGLFRLLTTKAKPITLDGRQIAQIHIAAIQRIKTQRMRYRLRLLEANGNSTVLRISITDGDLARVRAVDWFGRALTASQ